jgi:bacillolysin
MNKPCSPWPIKVSFFNFKILQEYLLQYLKVILIMKSEKAIAPHNGVVFDLVSKEILSALRLSWLILALLSPGLVYAQNESGIDSAESESVQIDTQDASLSFEMRQRRLLDQMRQQDPALDASWDARTGRLSRLSGELSEPMPGSGQLVALDFFVANRSLLNMTDPYGELTVIKAKVDHRGWENVKLQQSYKGLLVEGSQLILSIDDQRQVRMVNSRHYIGGIDLNTKPAISSGIATSIVRAHIAVQKEDVSGPTTTKVVYPYAGQILLAWKVQVFVHEPLGDFIYYVDAQTGAIINHYNNMPFALTQIVYNAATGTTFPPTIAQIVINNTPGEGTGHPTGDAVINKIYTNTIATYNFFNNAPYLRDGWDDAGGLIKSIGHWDSNLNDAIFMATGGVAFIRYGDGDGVFNNPYGNALDIVAHEFAHGVTGTESGLIYQGASGAMNESMSDIFGILAGASSVNDWLLAEDVYLPADLTVGMRSFVNPTLGIQPDHMDNFAIPDAGGSVYDQRCHNPPKNDNDCVHINSGIPNKAAYLMAAGGSHRGVAVNPLDGAIAASRVMMGRIFYVANTTYLTPSDDFAATKIATEDAVQALFPGDAAKLATVTNAWLAVGVPVPVSSGSYSYIPNDENRSWVANLPQNIPFGVDILAILALLGCASYTLIRFPHTNSPPTKSPKA